MTTAAISVRTRFERFPATVKGAFVIRGEDIDPHQVAVREARAVRLTGQVSRPLPVELVTVDVPPHQDLFVPFELSVTELDPGWYGLEVDLAVDGAPHTFEGDRRFVVAWPRGAIRSGSFPVERDMKLGEVVVRVEKVQCASDSLTVRFVVRPPGPVAVRLQADGSRLEPLEQDLDEGSGRGSATAYPVPRSARRLQIEVALAGGREREMLEVPLS